MSLYHFEQLPFQKKKIAVVTGANTGLGYETTLALAKKQMTVVMACRNAKKAQAALRKIKQQVPDAVLSVIPLDLSRLASVREFAATFLATHKELHLLVNNAGVMMPAFSLTEDGFESQMGTNYLGHFLLTALLFPLLSQPKHEPSRVISLSSIAHKQGKINFDDLQSQQKYSSIKAYSQSKLACLMFAYQLDRKVKAQNLPVFSVAAHPGVSDTELSRHLPSFVQKFVAPVFIPLFTHKPYKAAQPLIYASLGADVQSGDYYGPVGFREMKGEVGYARPTNLAQNEEQAARLWKVSEELTGTKF